MSLYVEPRFEALGNTFLDDPSEAGEQRPGGGRGRRHSFSHRAAAHDALQEALGGAAADCLAAQGPASTPPTSARPRPSSLSDLELAHDSPSEPGGSGESAGASPLDASLPPQAAQAGAPATPERRGGPRGPKCRALYDSNAPQAPAESAAAADLPDRRRPPEGTPRRLRQDGTASLELSPDGFSKARSRRGRGGKSRCLHDATPSQVSTESDVTSPGRRCRGWADGAASPSPPMSPDTHAPQEVLIADLLRTGSTAMLKATSLANRMRVGDTPKRRGSTGLLLDSLLGGAGGSGGCTPLGGTPLGRAPAAPPPQGTPPSPLPLLGAAAAPR